MAKHRAFLAEDEKYQAEMDASLSEIPNIVGMLNSLSPEEQQKFIANVKAMVRDNAHQAGIEDSDLLDEAIVAVLDLLIESGFEPRY